MTNVLKRLALKGINAAGYTLLRAGEPEAIRAEAVANAEERVARIREEAVANAEERVERIRQEAVANAEERVERIRKEADEDAEMRIGAIRSEAEDDAARRAERNRTEADDHVQVRDASLYPSMVSDIRPIEHITRGCFQDRTEATEASITEYMESEIALGRVFNYFSEYPTQSMLSTNARMAIFGLIRMIKPATVVEIGTYYAGTSEVIARALWENRSGVLHTVDPYGARRCPSILRKWPKELRDRVRYWSENSAAFFERATRDHLQFDMVFVDGNHDFEFALFDLMAAARLLRPGGLIIVDNCEQAGPLSACRSFLRDMPGWEEIGRLASSPDADGPFGAPNTLIADTGFAFLKGPDMVHVGERPVSFGQVRIEKPKVTGFQIKLGAESLAGTLHYRVLLRAFEYGTSVIEELKSTGAVRLASDGQRVVNQWLAEPLRTDFGYLYANAVYTTEVELAWTPDDGNTPLQLTKNPVILPLAGPVGGSA
ncbi:MAG: class I SAM-dependent methyltransferase [Methylobacteriaceae bacterium]|nr:class I SAM-dependent methyltransferase [Methylobacteriaceae bacterium]